MARELSPLVVLMQERGRGDPQLAHQVHFVSFPGSHCISSSNIIARGFKAIQRSLPACCTHLDSCLDFMVCLLKKRNGRGVFLSMENKKASEKLVIFSLKGLNPKPSSGDMF